MPPVTTKGILQTKPDHVLSVPCNREGEHPFVLGPPQGSDSFPIVVRCQESKSQTIAEALVPLQSICR